MLDVRVNKIDDNIDEVFIYQDEPYVNRAIYAKAGLFKAGKLSDKQITELEQKSLAAFAEDKAKREAAEKDDAEKIAEAKSKAKAPKGE